MYILICGKAPFKGRSSDETFDLIQQGKYDIQFGMERAERCGQTRRGWAIAAGPGQAYECMGSPGPAFVPQQGGAFRRLLVGNESGGRFPRSRVPIVTRLDERNMQVENGDER